MQKLEEIVVQKCIISVTFPDSITTNYRRCEESLSNLC